MRVMIVAGARPNFMKVAPIIRAMNEYNERKYLFDTFFVHTGQHYDREMSGSFLEDLGLPDPDVNLCCGRRGNTHAEQTAEIMMRIERLLIGGVEFRGVSKQPGKIDLVLVVGDVNSTLAAALAAAKLNVPVAHVEAGLRAFDMSMPEEVNRRLTDHISTLLFAPEKEAEKNLYKEFVRGRTYLAGDVMIDSLIYHMPQIDAALPRPEERGRGGDGRYAVMTLHRPSNVDDPDKFAHIFEHVCRFAERMPVWFSCHPRTRPVLEKCRELLHAGIVIASPMPYFSFMKMVKHAALVVTDSGSLQTETSFLGVPCVTLRTTTERPATLVACGGTNTMVDPFDGSDLDSKLEDVANREMPNVGCLPDTWDGNAAERIVEKIAEWWAGYNKA